MELNGGVVSYFWARAMVSDTASNDWLKEAHSQAKLSKGCHQDMSFCEGISIHHSSTLRQPKIYV